MSSIFNYRWNISYNTFTYLMVQKSFHDETNSTTYTAINDRSKNHLSHVPTYKIFYCYRICSFLNFRSVLFRNQIVKNTIFLYIQPQKCHHSYVRENTIFYFAYRRQQTNSTYTLFGLRWSKHINRFDDFLGTLKNQKY